MPIIDRTMSGLKDLAVVQSNLKEKKIKELINFIRSYAKLGGFKKIVDIC